MIFQYIPFKMAFCYASKYVFIACSKVYLLQKILLMRGRTKQLVMEISIVCKFSLISGQEFLHKCQQGIVSWSRMGKILSMQFVKDPLEFLDWLGSKIRSNPPKEIICYPIEVALKKLFQLPDLPHKLHHRCCVILKYIFAVTAVN